MLLVLLLFASILVGSIPWGVIVSRIFFSKDIRSEGSGNIGATNAARTLGKKGAAAVFLLDFGKGLLSGWFALLCAGQLVDEPELVPVAMALSFLGVVLGHVFSPWLGFKGGKGISAAFGNLFFLFGPLWALAELALFIVVVALSKYVSAGSIAAAIAAPFIALFLYWGQWVAVIIVLLAAVVVIWAHRGNIQRIAASEEHRIGGKK